MLRCLIAAKALQEWITFALPADGGCGAVAGDDAGLVWQREESAADRIHELRAISQPKIGAADVAGEERVASDECIEGSKEQADAAWGVTGRMDDLGGKAFEANQETVVETFIGRCGWRGGYAEPIGLLVHDFEKRQVILVEENGCAGELLEFESAAHVVDVGVGDEDLLERAAEGLEAAVNAADVFSRVDDDGFASLLIAKNGAVALQRADGEGLKDHGSILDRVN